MKFSIDTNFYNDLNPISKLLMIIGFAIINFAFWIQGYEQKTIVEKNEQTE